MNETSNQGELTIEPLTIKMDPKGVVNSKK